MRIINTDTRLNFGKYRNKSLQYIAEKDIGYIVWMTKTITDDEELIAFCNTNFKMEIAEHNMRLLEQEAIYEAVENRIDY